MSELIGPVVPPGQVPRELSSSESDRLFAISAEEPTTVTEAVQEMLWHRAMMEELRAIEENNTWELTAPLWQACQWAQVGFQGKEEQAW
jgi:hypothetical protein